MNYWIVSTVLSTDWHEKSFAPTNHLHKYTMEKMGKPEKKTLKQYFTRINIAHSLCLYLCVFYVQVTVTFEKGLCFCLLVGLLNTVISEQYVIYTKMAIILYL